MTHGIAAAIADDVLVLLKRGRVAPALAQLERLPGLIRGELVEAYQRGQLDLAREIAGDARAPHGAHDRTAKPKRSKPPRRHEWLAARLANPVARERAKAVLKLDDDRLLDAVAKGGVQLSTSQWRRLRQELGP